MSVLIKKMQMPKGCGKCVYCDKGWNTVRCHAKSKQGRNISRNYNIDDYRPDWCPLVELPEKHGRLIDADALCKDLSSFYDGEVTARQLIAKQPTVIGTEGET